MAAPRRLSRALRQGPARVRDRMHAKDDGASVGADDGPYEAARRTRWERTAAQPGPPIVVYAMGKSGTTAITDTLVAAGHSPVLKVHSLRPKRLEVMEAEYRRTDPAARPLHVWDAQYLLDHPATPEAPWTVITSVRDPIAQTVAKFFQSGERLGHIHADSTVASLQEAFGEVWKLPIDWFELQLGPCLGLDVYEHPFDPTVGWGQIDTPELHCLLLRLEGMDVVPDALGHHLGAPGPIPILRSNTGADKGYSELYRAFREQVRPPDEVIEAAYTSQLVRHFYTRAEIDGFRRYWTH